MAAIYVVITLKEKAVVGMTKYKLKIILEAEGETSDCNYIGNHVYEYEDVSLETLELSHNAKHLFWDNASLFMKRRQDLVSAGEVTLKFKCGGYKHEINGNRTTE